MKKSKTVYYLMSCTTNRILDFEFDTKQAATEKAKEMETKRKKFLVLSKKVTVKTKQEVSDHYKEYPEWHHKHWKKGTHTCTIAKLLSKGIYTNK